MKARLGFCLVLCFGDAGTKGGRFFLCVVAKTKKGNGSRHEDGDGRAAGDRRGKNWRIARGEEGGTGGKRSCKNFGFAVLVARKKFSRARRGLEKPLSRRSERAAREDGAGAAVVIVAGGSG